MFVKLTVCCYVCTFRCLKIAYYEGMQHSFEFVLHFVRGDMVRVLPSQIIATYYCYYYCHHCGCRCCFVFICILFITNVFLFICKQNSGYMVLWFEKLCKYKKN